MKTLDKSKPFGTIHGEGAGAVYEQGGVQFDADGKQVGASREAPAEKPAVHDEAAEQLASQTAPAHKPKKK